MLVIRRRREGRGRWSGHPPVWHAIQPEGELGRSRAVCGFRPGAPWAEEEGEEITCPRCLERMSQDDMQNVAQRLDGGRLQPSSD
jgi:hypothetical protein